MIKKLLKQIHTFRIFFFVFIVFATMSSIGIKPLDISAFFGAKIGNAVGLSVSVEENPFNKIAIQLKEKEDQLNERELALEKLQTDIERKQNNSDRFLLIGMAIGIFVLFVLISMNFYFDYRRKKLDKARV